ncbi:1-acyl-sn-glycerol-3-phosphate acyltransferase [Propionicimonas paludicola]|uniref:1-acyl-sn-glycerol-3-phosphate acyltransferase n=1 Tax=Propionicimonas paludicola TaxID=185243 RepID=A0A2A9CR46_9ACTN|nr:lysophospholipid acyltransferase family protein [Propionicimonas paludicola]PFG16555.1 1-acyl-sn-glycerol-3-phosphate acyltransferase [Propionicimonas paludicola]
MTSTDDHRPQPLPITSDPARVPLRIANSTPVQPTYRRLVRFAGWLLRLMVDRDWDDAANLPATGGVIVVSNHISYFDPPNLAHYLVWNGRWPRALGKADLWQVPIIGRLARATGQIPVERGTERAKDALVHAREALEQGECVVIYPEGTVTADPETWPMTPRPGAARLALASGAPVIPVGQWGANLVMPGKHPGWPKLRPRRTVSFRSGAPVDLSDLQGRTDAEAEAQAGARIMAAVTELVAQLRHETAPADVYDIRVGRRVPRLDAR